MAMASARDSFWSLIAGGSAAAADWPQWRGPNGTGATSETNLPVRWSASENVVWKAPIGGLGVSTPIVSGDRVFVTSQIGSGVRREGNHPRLVQGGNAADAGERELGASRQPATTDDAHRVPRRELQSNRRDSGSGSIDSRRRARCPVCTTNTIWRPPAR